VASRRLGGGTAVTGARLRVVSSARGRGARRSTGGSAERWPAERGPMTVLAATDAVAEVLSLCSALCAALRR